MELSSPTSPGRGRVSAVSIDILLDGLTGPVGAGPAGCIPPAQPRTARRGRPGSPRWWLVGPLRLAPDDGPAPRVREVGHVVLEPGKELERGGLCVGLREAMADVADQL